MIYVLYTLKVSATVTTFLVDMVAHCRLRETGGFIKAVQKCLNDNHPIRRLLLPFMYGTSYSNRVYNEYLKEMIIYRCFAFTYDGLSGLIKDAMSDAPDKRQRESKDEIKYTWRLAKVE